MDLPADLAAALEAATADLSLRELEASVERLIMRYRTPGRAARPILAGSVDAAAYAAYRMPATWGAVRAALGAVAERVPELGPRSLVDVGGGSGAAAWAASGVFPSLKDIVVLDQVGDALELGRRLARDAFSGALRHAEWRQVRFPAEIPEADLVTVSYVLSELSAEDQDALVRASAVGAGTIAVVEPGTPDGYQRIMAARDVLIAMGLRVVAPCPHSGACPLAGTRDWCHFAARVHRSPLHRRLKGGDLGHEDEKFAYVVATRVPVPESPARVLRHPQIRKGLVMMQLCEPDGATAQTLVSKRQGDTYRAARDVDWGDLWRGSAD
ncbi:small ribosomal subunit Rsm22 family protein [Catenulispora subtropica]|uniref:Small ribosomal subunit Rsm22 family protein n=1 Tax=Catenulispora subtropica TaxID=450798 RepID=A0ABN2T0D6_9ACTN